MLEIILLERFDRALEESRIATRRRVVLEQAPDEPDDAARVELGAEVFVPDKIFYAKALRIEKDKVFTSSQSLMGSSLTASRSTS